MRFRHRFDIEQVCDFIRRAALELGYDPQTPPDMLRPAMNADGVFFTHTDRGFYCYKVLQRCAKHGPEKDQRVDLIPHINCAGCKTIIIGTLLKKDVLTDRHEADAFPQGGAPPTTWVGKSPRVFTGLSKLGGTNGSGDGRKVVQGSKFFG